MSMSYHLPGCLDRPVTLNVLLIVLFGSMAGCAADPDATRVRHLSAAEALEQLSCRRGDRAVCTERMGELVGCVCASDGAFRKMLER